MPLDIMEKNLRQNIIQQKRLEAEIAELEYLLDKKINRLANLRYDERNLKTKIHEKQNSSSIS
jgi:hypothetical protein